MSRDGHPHDDWRHETGEARPTVGPMESSGVSGADPWRINEWHALPDECFIAGCDGWEIDQRGPVFLRDGTIRKACIEHWEGIMRVLGEQASWEHADAMQSGMSPSVVDGAP